MKWILLPRVGQTYPLFAPVVEKKRVKNFHLNKVNRRPFLSSDTFI